jgi:glutamate-5-semialdehyde dehydrogenase
MTAPVKTIEADISAVMRDIGQRARLAGRALALAPTTAKNNALHAMAQAIRANSAAILSANAQDIADARAAGATAAFLDRLTLDARRVEAMAAGVEAVAGLPDPVGAVMDAWTRPNGMTIERVRVPLGSIGVIYESRPNVTADAGSLCIKAGNAVVLRGGSDSFRSSRAIHAALAAGLADAGLPVDAIQLVQAEARVPVFAHLDGNCHVYVDGAADAEMAKTVVLNAKMRRTGVCGAAETLLVDRAAAPRLLAVLVTMLIDAGCEVRGDAATQAIDARVKAATEEDWATEYLDAIIAVKVVDGVDGAIRHIERHGSHHTDAIVTADRAAADKFMAEVDSAIVLHNASTQFADGGEFGFGAEIGIATGRLHARGPVGVEQLTTFKYRVHGSGQIRP